MIKIVFFMPFYAFPIPSTMGGGVEELMTILLEKHEKKENEDVKFYFVQKQLYGKNKKFETENIYRNSELVKVKYNRFFNFLVRGFNRLLKCLKINKRFSNDYYNKAFKEVKKINPDLIIFERDYDVITKRFVKEFGKEKLSFHIHTQILDQDKENLNKYFGSIITVSKFISEDYKKFLGDSSKLKHYVLLNCVNEERFNKRITSEERENIRNRFGFSKDDFVVVFCGRLCEDKGIDILVETFEKLDKNIKLLIVGGVETANNKKSAFLFKLKQMIEKNPDQIKTTGYIKNSELYRFYESADLQVVPSMWEEAAGLIVIEGQMCGLPQIITKSGGMVEFASKSGTIILPKDENLKENLAKEITRLSKEKDTLKKMSEENIKHGNMFNKQRYYKEFIEIVEDLNKENE